mmetsp:Transcript_28855/g.52781  ORF Transcript_28855/g.52781 Transcript_28855/m.52781 type:complete len:88 (-) Transcript_28855:633-896(-)
MYNKGGPLNNHSPFAIGKGTEKRHTTPSFSNKRPSKVHGRSHTVDEGGCGKDSREKGQKINFLLGCGSRFDSHVEEEEEEHLHAKDE